MNNLNYASIVLKILDIGIQERFVNFCGEGDIYQINVLDVNDYPIFWVAVTEPIIEKENSIQYPLTLYYVDREKTQNDDRGDTDGILIHNTGITVLSNIIKKIKMWYNDVLLNDIGNVNYTLWSETEIFADKTNGVYCTIILEFPKGSNCPVD